MTLFDKLYGAGVEVIQTALKPIRAKMLSRAFESFTDDVESTYISVSGKLEELRHSLANAEDQDDAEDIIAEIVRVTIDLQEAEMIGRLVEKEKALFFGEVKE